MLSQLGPLFKTVFRETEHADARLEIRREEKENGPKNKGQDKENTDDNSLWEDSMGVSVAALRTFLIEFLKEKHQTLITTNEADTPVSSQSEIRPQSAASRAAQAYGATASHTHHYEPPPQRTEPEQSDDPSSLLESGEVREIHRLIGELDTLDRAGVETLTFQLSGTFLESVSLAVRSERTRLGI